MDEDESFNEGISQEIEGLTDKERASLAESDNSDLGDDNMTEDDQALNIFPSLNPTIGKDGQKIKAMKFRAEKAEKEAIEAAERQRMRDFLLEQELIREQGPLDKTRLSQG